MSDEIYTHALWRVKPGYEDKFVMAWSELSRAFSALEAQPLWGTLIRSTADPSVFYSFGPWQRIEDVLAMREDANAKQAIATVREFCTEATPETCQLIKHVVPGQLDVRR